MNSTRLQGKVLLKLDEFSVLDYVISQVRASKNIGKIIIATTQENSDNVIVEYAKKMAYHTSEEMKMMFLIDIINVQKN